MREDCVLLEKLRKLQRVVHVVCALCALGFKKDGKVRKLERYITQRSVPVWVLTSRHTVYEYDVSVQAGGTFRQKCYVMIQQEWIMQDGYTFAGTDQSSCQSMAHIAIYVNLLQEPYVLSRYTYFQITAINLLNEHYYCQMMLS